MSVLAAFAGRRAQREVVDGPEARPPERGLEQLLGVRRQRLERLERERREVRAHWRALRLALRETRQRWRAALCDAEEDWRKAQGQFFGMLGTSGQFRSARQAYQDRRDEAGALRLACREHAAGARSAGRDFFAVRRRVGEARLRQEKLTMLRDALRLAEVKGEA
ncbi:hypothetical protein HSX11_09425 [Oxalobacteraceae bacterium]|nr:hypothetical protein [Oxalobacteraceae bacterium]